MNKLQKFLLAGSVAGVVVLAVALVNGVGTETVVREVTQLGASSGPEHTQHQVFKQNFTRGGRSVATTSTAATFTLTSKEANLNTSYLSWNPSVNLTLTTMASTSEPLSQLKAGEELSMCLYNASTTAGATITLAAGTGVDLQEDEGETVIVNGLEISRLTFLKKADGDVIAWLEVGQVGD